MAHLNRADRAGAREDGTSDITQVECELLTAASSNCCELHPSDIAQIKGRLTDNSQTARKKRLPCSRLFKLWSISKISVEICRLVK
jgi:hypothetical protein